MAKFCGNCGAKLDDNARVCGQCGTPINGSLNGSLSKAPDLKIVNPEKKKKNRKRIKLIISLILIAAVAAVAWNVVSNFTGSKGLLRKVMAAYQEYDIDTLASLASEMYYYDNDEYLEQYLENCVGDDLDYFESSVGHSYKLSYEINEIYTLSDRKFDMLTEDIKDRYSDFDVSLIEKAAVADLTLTVKQGSKSINQDLTVTMTKEENSWKLLYIE